MSLYDTSICDGYDNTYFQSGNRYRFEVNIYFEYENVIRQKSETYIVMTANSPPTNGTCYITNNGGNYTTFDVLDEEIGIFDFI